MISPTASRICLLLALGAAGLSTAGNAQSSEKRFQRISVSQGLAQNTVYAIMQDRLGFLWIGTSDGSRLLVELLDGSQNGLKKFFLGNLLDEVTHQAPCPVLVVQDREVAQHNYVYHFSENMI